MLCAFVNQEFAKKGKILGFWQVCVDFFPKTLRNRQMSNVSDLTHPIPKTALITGGAIRIGRHITLRLAQEGWNIALHYHNSEDEAKRTLHDIQAFGVNATLIKADLSKPDTAAILFKDAQEKLGTIGALINNAAVIGHDRPSHISAETFDTYMHINLRAPLLLSQTFAEQLPKDTHGCIVNMIDGCEGFCLSPSFLSYSLSKNGLAYATRLLAQDFAPRIRVNGVSPGFTLPKDNEDRMFDRLVMNTPLQTPSALDDITNAVLFLLSASSVTGQVLSVNSGAGL